MDASSYRPRSPDLSSYAPRSPDLSGQHCSQSQDFTGIAPNYQLQPHYNTHLTGAFGNGHSNGWPASYHNPPTSVPRRSTQPAMASRRYKSEDDDPDYLPDAPAQTATKQEYGFDGAYEADGATSNDAQSEDPTMGCTLKTSFPVARIKRIMQADEDIGKVAQVTPTVVSRALELFMIRIISGAAHQARGTGQAGAGKGPRRVLVQHLKRAVMTDQTMDFLQDIVEKVPDAPAKAKKEVGSDSEDAKPKRRSKKRKDSGDDF